MKLCEKIYELRKKSGMSQEELAEKLDVLRQAVSRWEVGTAIPGAVNIHRLSRIFGVTADYLLNDEYDGDGDVPAVKAAEKAWKNTFKRAAAFPAMAFGLFGNGVIYILSRFIPVMVPRTYYENGVKMYEWGKLKGRSYIYFISEYDLELLAALLWLIFLAGLIYFVLTSKPAKKAFAKLKTPKK